MKNIMVAALLLVALGLGAFCLQQHRQLAQTRAQLAASQKQLAEKSGAVDQTAFAERKAKALQQALVQTSALADEKTRQAEQLQESLTSAKTNNPLQGMVALFKDPKMREMMKSQQKTFLGPMIDKQYAALFQQLNLTPDQAAQLKDLLEQKMLAASDTGMALLNGDQDAAQRAELTKQIQSQTADSEAQIKQFLGDENYTALEAYEKTTPDRLAVSQFSDQLASGGTALSPDQESRLIQLMSDERNGYKWTIDYNDKSAVNGDFSSLFTEDKINQFAQEKERLDQQILTRAQSILTPAQYKELEQFQLAQRNLQIAGMKMAMQMFAPKSQ